MSKPRKSWWGITLPLSLTSVRFWMFHPWVTKTPDVTKRYVSLYLWMISKCLLLQISENSKHKKLDWARWANVVQQVGAQTSMLVKCGNVTEQLNGWTLYTVDMYVSRLRNQLEAKEPSDLETPRHWTYLFPAFYKPLTMVLTEEHHIQSLYQSFEIKTNACQTWSS